MIFPVSNSISAYTKLFPVSKDIGLLIPSNFQWRRILGRFQKILCITDCHEVILTKPDIEVGGEMMTLLRGPDEIARRTIITNTGATWVQLYEGQRLILILPPRQEHVLKFGKLVLHGLAMGLVGEVTVSTYEQCLCGDEPPVPYGDDAAIGGNLL